MIQTHTKLSVGDNSGIKKLKCIKIKNCSRGNSVPLGQDLLVSIRSIKPKSGQRLNLHRGDKLKGFLLHSRARQVRKNGLTLCFDENRALCWSKNGNLIGNRLLYPLPLELRKRKFMKVVSLAPNWV